MKILVFTGLLSLTSTFTTGQFYFLYKLSILDDNICFLITLVLYWLKWAVHNTLHFAILQQVSL